MLFLDHDIDVHIFDVTVVEYVVLGLKFQISKQESKIEIVQSRGETGTGVPSVTIAALE